MNNFIVISYVSNEITTSMSRAEMTSCPKTDETRFYNFAPTKFFI
jgi:hypothetical protein